MAEPAASTAGIAIAAGPITLTGSIFGLQYDLLLAGFFGGLVSLSYLPAMSPWKIVGSVAGSSILAGYFSPVVAAAGLNFFPWLSGVGDFTRVAAAAALGLCWQVTLPAVMGRLRSMLGVTGGAQ